MRLFRPMQTSLCPGSFVSNLDLALVCVCVRQVKLLDIKQSVTVQSGTKDEREVQISCVIPVQYHSGRMLTSCNWMARGLLRSDKCGRGSLQDLASSPGRPGCPPPGRTEIIIKCLQRTFLFLSRNLLEADGHPDLPEDSVHLAACHDRLLQRKTFRH